MITLQYQECNEQQELINLDKYTHENRVGEFITYHEMLATVGIKAANALRELHDETVASRHETPRLVAIASTMPMDLLGAERDLPRLVKSREVREQQYISLLFGHARVRAEL